MSSISIHAKRRSLWCFASVAALLITNSSPVQATVAKWSANGHGYEAVLAIRTWQQAQDECVARGGYLATISSDGENCLIYGLFGLAPEFWYVDSFNNGLGPWFGGQQVPGSGEPVGTWEWVTGEPWGFTNWTLGHPDNCCGLNQNKTIFFRPGNTGLGCGWDDAEQVPPSGYVRGYIFETDNPPLDAPILQTPTSCCGVPVPTRGRTWGGLKSIYR